MEAIISAFDDAAASDRPHCFIAYTIKGYGLPLAGLMCVPPADIEPAPFFAFLDKLARDHGLAGRSMGMSGDFATAIMLGATHVRVGTALFGVRATT